jgi:hypothetical protein
VSQRLFSVPKVGLFLDSYKPAIEKRRGEEVKVIQMTLRLQPFDGKLARAIDDGVGEDSNVKVTLFKKERVSVVLDLSQFRKHEVATFMTAFMENLYRLKAREQYRTPMMLVVDEADAIAPQKPQKGEERRSALLVRAGQPAMPPDLMCVRCGYTHSHHWQGRCPSYGGREGLFQSSGDVFASTDLATPPVREEKPDAQAETKGDEVSAVQAEDGRGSGALPQVREEGARVAVVSPLQPETVPTAEASELKRLLEALDETSVDDAIDRITFENAHSLEIAKEIKRLESWPPNAWPSLNDRLIYAALFERAQKAEAAIASSPSSLPAAAKEPK